MTSLVRIGLLGFMAVLSAAAATPSRQEALAAIEVLEKRPLSDDALAASHVITQFAEESEDVIFTVGPDTLPWLEEVAESDEGAVQAISPLLLAAYFAGNAREQLKKGRPEDHPYEGWLFMLRTYRRFQEKHPIQIAAIERLAELEKAGRLKDHAAEAVKPPSGSGVFI